MLEEYMNNVEALMPNLAYKWHKHKKINGADISSCRMR